MQTLLLDLTEWDLVIDAYGDIAVASDPYSISQDICSAVRLMLGELWYDTSRGIPYYQQVIGKTVNLALLKSFVEAAAKTVTGVLTAQCFISAFKDRTVTGQIQFTYAVATSNGTTTTIGVVSFIGDNRALVTFVGDDNVPITFTGTIV